MEGVSMTFIYRKGDLFTMPREYCLAHCISADFVLGAGIAKQFDRIYQMRFKLNNRYGDIPQKERVGKTYFVDNVFNLITKEWYYNKPTYETLTHCLEEIKERMIQLNITKLAIPKIGCGLDRLQWNVVEQIIKGVFANTDVEIVVNEFELQKKI